MSYDSALAKINAVKNEVNDGANTANRVGDAMEESLNFTNTKSDLVNIANYRSEGAELPLASHYVFNGRPVQTISGQCTETGDVIIAFCTNHLDEVFLITLYIRNEQNKFIFSNQFNDRQASTELEKCVVEMFSGSPATYTRNGSMSKEDKQLLDEMASEVFPLEVTVGSYTNTYEVGSVNVKPEIPVAIKRHGEYVDGDATIQVTPNTADFDTTNHKIVDGSTLYTQTTGTHAYRLTATQGGQTREVSALVNVRYYAYYGDIGTSALADATAVKDKIESSWRDTNKKFSTKTDSTLITSDGKVTNQANHYYLFAVQGTRTLIVKNAATGGVVTGCAIGTVTIERVNETDSDTYTYVIVPASPNSWDFKITNS